MGVDSTRFVDDSSDVTPGRAFSCDGFAFLILATGCNFFFLTIGFLFGLEIGGDVGVGSGGGGREG